MSEWIEITADPATLPPPYQLIVIRNSEGLEYLGTREAEPEKYSDWCWSKGGAWHWSPSKQAVVCCEEDLEPQDWIVTHWRPI